MIIAPHIVTANLITLFFERLRLKNKNLHKRKLYVALSCLTAFLSHFAIDAIPHYDYSIYEPNKIDSAAKLIIDMLAGLLICSLVLKNSLKEFNINLKTAGMKCPTSRSKSNSVGYFLGTAALSMLFAILPDIITVWSRETQLLSGFVMFHNLVHSKKFVSVFTSTFIYMVFLTTVVIIGVIWHGKLRTELNVAEIEEEEKEFLASKLNQS